MNPLNLSPAAQLFWGSIIRHLLGFIGTAIVAHGYVSQSGASAYTEEMVGVIINGAVLIWSNRVAYWSEIKHLVGRAMPAGTTDVAVVAKVNSLAAAKALPSVFTPPDTVPTLVKP
jgi:hypothetical protein